MAEPARQFEKDTTPGNVDSAPPGRPQPTVSEGTAETMPANGSWYNPDGAKKSVSPGELSVLENSAGQNRGEPSELPHENQIGGGYSGSKTKPTGFFQQVRNHKKLFAGAGVIVGLIITAFIVLFGFLNIFKLDGMMSNIDSKTFARLNGVADRRSLAWMEAYMQMRLADIGDNPNLDKGADSDNAIFRAERVRENPLTDWYKTLLT
jgi:hypothetical protein